MSDPQYLTTIVKWFQELPLAARRGLSLANLHDLSKRLIRQDAGVADDAMKMVSTRKNKESNDE